MRRKLFCNNNRESCLRFPLAREKDIVISNLSRKSSAIRLAYYESVIVESRKTKWNLHKISAGAKGSVLFKLKARETFGSI